MGRTFQKIHASMVGKFDDGIGDKIPQWIRANGGQFSRDVSSRVTHLIATEKAYKDNAPLVQNAKMLGTVKIVTFDWLEDSLQAATRRPKTEGPYLLQSLMKPNNPEKKTAKNGPTKVTKKEAKPMGPKRQIVDPFVAPKGKKKPVRRVYIDKKGVSYSTTLFRPTKAPSKGREKYLLTTIAEPHTYSTYAKFSRVAKSTVEVVASPKSKLESARAKFANFFKEKVGKEWEDRADGKIPPPKVDSDGKSLPIHEGWFCLEQKRSHFGDFLRGTQTVVPEATDGCDGGELDSEDEDTSMEDQVGNAVGSKDSSNEGNEVNETSAIDEDSQ